MLKLGLLASHGGSNMQCIIDACAAGALQAQPAVVISNNRDSQALERARRANIPCFHLSPKTHREAEELDGAMLSVLRRHGVELVVLAGYMRKIGPKTLAAYNNRILNIHPALLPKFGGQGMYGSNVHQAVISSGEKESGATIHLVDEHYDHGPILAQRRVPVLDGDTPEALAARVLEQEHILYVETIAKIVSGEIRLP